MTIGELSVAAHGGRVTLRGAVADAVSRERALDLVRSVDGVHDVDDLLHIVPPPPPAAVDAEPTAAGTLYVAQPGDTLPDIAERLLGRRSRWRELHELNRGIVSSPIILQPGLKLKVPKR